MARTRQPATTMIMAAMRMRCCAQWTMSWRAIRRCETTMLLRCQVRMPVSMTDKYQAGNAARQSSRTRMTGRNVPLAVAARTVVG